MLTLLIRTDQPEAELYLFEDSSLLAELKWEAHRVLADSLNKKIDELLGSVHRQSWYGVGRIGVYEGPGSFTGLRIGISVANALGYSLNVPVVQATGNDWIETCLRSTINDFVPARPVYGSEPNTTKPKK